LVHIGERRSDDCSNTEIEESPRSVFSRRTTSKVTSRNDEDLGFPVTGLVEDEFGLL